MVSSSETIKRLRTAYLFSLMDDSQLDALAKIVVPVARRAGEIVFSQGDEGDSLLLISRGAVKVTRDTEEGRSKTLAVLFEGDLLGEMAVLDDRRRSATAQCIEDCEFLVIYGSDFRELLKRDFGTNLRLLTILTRRLRETDDQLVDIAYRGARERLLTVLRDLASRRGRRTRRGFEIDLQLTHEELASCLGVSRETVTRLLSALLDEGVVGYSGRRILVSENVVDQGTRA